MGWDESAGLRRDPADSNPTLLGSSVDQHTEPIAEYNRSGAILSIEAAWSAAVAASLDATYKIDDLVAEAVARCGGRTHLAQGDETECWNRFSRIYSRLAERAATQHAKEPDVMHPEHADVAGDLGLGRTTGSLMPSRATSPPNGFASLRAILHPESDTLES